MNTFYIITKKLINLDNNVFSLDYDKTDLIPFTYKIWFSILYNGRDIMPFYKNKFKFLYDTINGFYFKNNLTETNTLINYFCKIQKTYYLFNRLALLYKYKKSKMNVTTDLQLNEISLSNKNVICIYQNDTRYLFKMEDLLKMTFMALTNSYLFFAEPTCVKNPYNNIPFSKAILYNIYINLMMNTSLSYIKYDYLDLFLKFKQCHFNMTLFVNKYEHILKDYAVKNYINNSTPQVLRRDILDMIKDYNYSQNYKSKRIYIHTSFPSDTLIQVMKPYLQLKILSQYSLIKTIKLDSEIKVYKKLREFQQFNPKFGRKIINFRNMYVDGIFKSFKLGESFNTIHKKFNTSDTYNFMKNHLSYEYKANNATNTTNTTYTYYQSTESDDETLSNNEEVSDSSNEGIIENNNNNDNIISNVYSHDVHDNNEMINNTNSINTIIVYITHNQLDETNYDENNDDENNDDENNDDENNDEDQMSVNS